MFISEGVQEYDDVKNFEEYVSDMIGTSNFANTANNDVSIIILFLKYVLINEFNLFSRL